MDDTMGVKNQINEIREMMVGFRYKHFKGGIYIVKDIGINTETGELEVIYKAFNNPELTWCRNLDVFLSEVDKEKYPDTKQEMRFERVRDE